jgi:Peptidase family S41
LKRAAWALFTMSISAPSVGHAAPTLASDHTAAVREIENVIEKNYVFAELRPAIRAQLERSRLAHRYEVMDPDLFVARINEDLKSAAHDGHLYLANDRAEYAAMLAPADSSDGLDAYRRALAIRDHSGLTKMEILPGNIRYLKLERFQWIPGATVAAYDSAANFLMDGDAVIIDLRDNGGGTSDAADYFSTVFLAPDPLRATSASSRERNPGWIGKPLYLLVNGSVGSAAEAVAYDAQQEKTATIVGSTTYGAANNNKKFPIAPQFVLSVSYNRPINSISGTNWEGVGVKPDISVVAYNALPAAEAAALDRLSVATTPPNRLAEYRWARIAVGAQLNPVIIAPGRLRDMAGHYGTIELKASKAGLRFYRSDRPQRPQGVAMTPLDSQGLFGIDGYDDLRALVTGRGIILLHGAEDQREAFPRSGDETQ